MSQILDRPREIVEFCLKPFALSKDDASYQEAYRRLMHVIRSYQQELVKAKRPVAVDFSHIKTITIDETAHGHD